MAFFAILAAAASLSAAAPGGTGNGGDMTVMTSITAADVTALIEQQGGTVGAVLPGDEGFTVNFQFSSGLNAYVEGYDCLGGPSADAVCSDLEIGGVFTADDQAHAIRTAAELNYVWVADWADLESNEVTFWRRDCLHGGVTRNQIGYWFTIMDEQLIEVANAMWPGGGNGLAPQQEPVET